MNQHDKPFGTRSSAPRRRLNLKYSRRKLEALLSYNFTSSAQLVTLTYREERRPRSRDLAVVRQCDWMCGVHGICQTEGRTTKYALALEWPGGESGPVHRVVLECGIEAGVLAALWPYGTVSTERVDLSSGWDGVAALLMRGPIGAGQAPIPCARAWSVSKGLPRPPRYNGKVNENEAQKEA